ncbi:hypothetical protein SIM22_05115 [Bacillus cereus group sp. BfR-BA-01363]|uniref:hypothetical protein n=1 Tax=Bacillus cereus group sp. BfR-BA-01363 TaxID=3094882 RepID=UPI0029C2DF98|nr:hypothetical protein [Bacillus cereus group sp. BfR-BA-01363]MDX5853512.1 hypothetical protein [Bacillus cereus group sp. BfR-BA-01363]
MMMVLIKHEMDTVARKMTLNDAFLEALELSGSRTSDIEKQEDDLLQYLRKHPQFIHKIEDGYKIQVLLGWNYEVKTQA